MRVLHDGAVWAEGMTKHNIKGRNITVKGIKGMPIKGEMGGKMRPGCMCVWGGTGERRDNNLPSACSVSLYPHCLCLSL